jgi:hypothetical protein
MGFDVWLTDTIVSSSENITRFDGLAAGWTGHFQPAFLGNLLAHFE